MIGNLLLDIVATYCHTLPTLTTGMGMGRFVKLKVDRLYRRRPYSMPQYGNRTIGYIQRRSSGDGWAAYLVSGKLIDVFPTGKQAREALESAIAKATR